MKRLKDLTFLFLIGSMAISIAQERKSLFKGLLIGMNKKEVRQEYKKNKEIYTNVDFGNGWVFRTDLKNIYVDSNLGLKGLYFFPKGTKLSGIGYLNTRNALEMTRQFFTNIGYTVFYENKYWNLPLNFSNIYGLIMADKEKTKIVHLFPTKAPNNSNSQTIGLVLYEYKIFVKNYNERLKMFEKKKKNTGF